jgi:hypothetical protein
MEAEIVPLNEETVLDYVKTLPIFPECFDGVSSFRLPTDCGGQREPDLSRLGSRRSEQERDR